MFGSREISIAAIKGGGDGDTRDLAWFVAYFPPINSFAIVASCMFDVPS
jgi:hypothetical protein